MNTKSKISGHFIRGGAWAVFLSVAFIALSSASDSPNGGDKTAVATGGYDSTAKRLSQPTVLSFAERGAFQRAIEEVYWRHRIWPKENPDPKPALDAVMSQTQLENKVAGYLRDSLVLEDYWQKPITAEQLQAEMDRMARDTKQSEVLRELFEALGNDPAVIAECLARPILAERLIADLSAQDQTRHVESPQTDPLRTMPVVRTLGQVAYTLPKIADAGDPPCTDDTWTAPSTTNAPSARYLHTAVWTGSEMIVWGGIGNTGGRYNPSTDSWTATSTTNAPAARFFHTAVWTGSEMIVWGGDGGRGAVNTGGRYNPGRNTWSATSTTNAPSVREEHAAVWTGSEMIAWGGSFYDHLGNYVLLNTGGIYNPNTDSWAATSITNAPSARDELTAVWTGSQMIIWGGYDSASLNTGGRYNPSTNSWTATSLTNAPSARSRHTAVSTGSQMIVWGGSGFNGIDLNTGGKYNPSTDGWTATSTTNAPSARQDHTAVWTGSEMIVWGGVVNGPTYLNTGGRYNATTDTWVATSTTNAPSAREGHTAVWTDSEMIVWGGTDDSRGFLNTGGRYSAPGLLAQLGNISTRAFVQTDDNVEIGGFIVTGTQPKKVIVRALGPSLSVNGVPVAGKLENPTLELDGPGGVLIASNDNWRSLQEAEIIASTVPPANDWESAIVATLPANSTGYTAIVRGVNNTTGIALVEVYDLDQTVDSKLANISTRGFVQTGDNVLIGGIIVLGTESTKTILRAIGPSLASVGISGALADPTLELHDGDGALIAFNDNWKDTQEAEVIATTIPPTNDAESAIVATLAPGNYTAIVRGTNNTTGIALVEAYQLPN